MSASRIGIWFVGARGDVAATATLGLTGLSKQLVGPIGLVSGLPHFGHLDFLKWENVVVGGHEIRETTLGQTLGTLCERGRTFDPALLEACRQELDAVDERIVWGTLSNCGPAIAELIGVNADPYAAEDPGETIVRLQEDLRNFQRFTGVEGLIVVYLASTEPSPPVRPLPVTWSEMERSLGDLSLPASSLYAIAALDLGFPFINFTPSLGAAPEAIGELAELRGTCHAGCDGKTGETLLKSVLAPMFACRNLEVMSWIGHNILGNRDAQVLNDPANKSSKLRSKDRLLGQLLEGTPQTLVSIEYIKSLGDWKTAWDHVHFRGFLGTPMTLQFTWQGCDSLLAAPLVLDLVRFVELAHRRGETGVLTHLCSFFKSPLGTEEHAFALQFQMLEQWAQSAGKDIAVSASQDRTWT